ncbi:uncharacterized protein LOC123297490 [Chrysoperla carnea]|uniref:uncharacterized protein LOC123297490 n=1 Tax=Chrysoperla carnea TaxID=189513 RepID=UPI001D08536F|nr:uncharacterized protein LOC123297490 [Chrysoperla carnea]
MEGYYTNYEGLVIVHESQMWLSDRMLAKIIDDIMLDNLASIPNVKQLPEEEINLPFRAPFNKNKRFPEVGKYIRICVFSQLYALFSQIQFIDKPNRKQNNLDVARSMTSTFQYVQMIDRLSFEKMHEILWKKDSNNQDTAEENGYYTPYEGTMFLYERQIWFSDKMFAKILNERTCGKVISVPDFTMPAMSEKNLPFRAPFSENKRFPSIGKYIQVNNNNSEWREALTNPGTKAMDLFNRRNCVFNRQSFEVLMEIKWIPKPLAETATKNDSTMKSNVHDVD